MTEKERMLSEQLYIAKDTELAKDNIKARKLTRIVVLLEKLQKKIKHIGRNRQKIRDVCENAKKCQGKN